jgi:hypothetical protein
MPHSPGKQRLRNHDERNLLATGGAVYVQSIIEEAFAKPDPAYDSPEFHKSGFTPLAVRNAEWGGFFAGLKVGSSLRVVNPDFEALLDSLALSEWADLRLLQREFLRHEVEVKIGRFWISIAYPNHLGLGWLLSENGPDVLSAVWRLPNGLPRVGAPHRLTSPRLIECLRQEILRMLLRAAEEAPWNLEGKGGSHQGK